MSPNPKYFSNTEESIKVLEEIVVPYFERERERTDNLTQVTLFIPDVLKGQMTKDVTDLLLEDSIYLGMSSNMIQLFEPLDLTLNGHCKSYMSAFGNLATDYLLGKTLKKLRLNLLSPR